MSGFRPVGEAAAPLVERVTRGRVLDAARDAVTRDRAAIHGAPENIFAAIARVWSARLGQAISPAQVCLMLVDLKVARAWSNPDHADNWVDIAGYGACGGEVAGALVAAGTKG